VIALALALTLSLSPVPAGVRAGVSGDVQGAFPYPVHRRVLPNGLQVLLVRQDTPGLAALFTIFRVGSRDEVEAGRSGYAHLFEHVSFRGTPSHSGADWERLTKSLGLDTNAFTDDDLTAYWSSGPSDALGAMIPLEADRFMNLAYGEDAFKVESRAVLGEYLKSIASPDFKILQASRELAFTRHPYRHDALGLEKDVRDMPGGYRYAQELYRRFYRPDNAIVLVVGDFDEEQVFDAVRRAFGPWRASGEAMPSVPAEPPQREERQARHRWPTPILPRLWSGWHTPGAPDVEATAVQLVAWPLLFGRPSPLYQDLVLHRHLVEEISGDFQPHRDPYLFGVELVLKSAAAEAPARAAVDRAVSAVAAGEVDARYLADVKANVLASIVMQTDTGYRTGVWLAYYLAAGGEAGYLDAVMARVAQVSAGDLARFAKRFLVPESRTTVVVAP
jgi:zinc protease